MAQLSDADKRRLVIDSCKVSYAHDFIETLPDVRIESFTGDSEKPLMVYNRDMTHGLASAEPRYLAVRSNAS